MQIEQLRVIRAEMVLLLAVFFVVQIADETLQRNHWGGQFYKRNFNLCFSVEHFSSYFSDLNRKFSVKIIKIRKDDEDIPMNITSNKYEYNFRLHDWVANKNARQEPRTIRI